MPSASLSKRPKEAQHVLDCRGGMGFRTQSALAQCKFILITAVVLSTIEAAVSIKASTIYEDRSALSVETTRLSLANATLEVFPTIPLLRLPSLLELNLDLNHIKHVDESAYSSNLVSLSLQGNEMETFNGYFPRLQSLSLAHNHLTTIPDGIFQSKQLTKLNMTGNAPLLRDFTAAQAAFLQNLSWDLTEDDFVELGTCVSGFQRIHSVNMCIIDTAVESNGQTVQAADIQRRLYSYENAYCPGYYSGGVLAGSIIGTAVFMILVGFVVWKWKMQQHPLKPKKPEQPSTRIQNGYVSVWHDPQLLKLQLKADDIEDVRKIGGGAFADVWLVKYQGTRLLASKRLRKENESRQYMQSFAEEIKMVAKFDHPNIVKLVGAAWTVESDLQALSEYMVGGDVREFLIYPQTPRVWTARKRQIAMDVIEALVYVHSFVPPVVHRDLKSRNILLSRDMRAKLADFGVSRFMSEENTMTQGVGTSRWEAPEVLAGREDYNQAADIFSFGVVLSELDTHAVPYDDARGPNDNTLANVAILQMIAMGVIRPSFSSHCPPDIRALADRCLAHNPEDRPSAPEVAYALRTTMI